MSWPSKVLVHMQAPCALLWQSLLRQSALASSQVNVLAGWRVKTSAFDWIAQGCSTAVFCCCDGPFVSDSWRSAKLKLTMWPCDHL